MLVYRGENYDLNDAVDMAKYTIARGGMEEASIGDVMALLEAGISKYTIMDNGNMVDLIIELNRDGSPEAMIQKVREYLDGPDATR